MTPDQQLTTTTSSTWKLSSATSAEPGSPEQLLVDAVKRMATLREGRVAVHIHLSKLQQHHRKDHYLRIAMDTFEQQVKGYAGHIFTLSNQDVFFLAKDLRMSTLVEAVDRLRLLFAEDPITSYSEDDEQSGFATYYDFETNYDLLKQDTQILAKTAERQRKTREADQSKGSRPAQHGRPFHANDLAKLTTILERADLGNVIRRQTACVLPESGIPQPLFEESFVSIDDLQNICTPDIDLLSNRWLFHYLCRTLDKRMMALMTRNGIRQDLPFSLNLNVETLLSPEFRLFDEKVPSHLRGKTVIELHKVDVFSDIGAFIFARDFLHERGHRLCLDGLTHHTLPFFDNNRLELDLFKIYWGPEGLKTAHPSTYPEIKEMLTAYGARRTILCRCDSEDAIRVGHELGITQFQGRIIDRLLGYTRNTRALPKQ